MKLLILITLFTVPAYLCSMENVKTHHKPSIAYIVAKIKYQQDDTNFSIETIEKTRIFLPKYLQKKEELQNAIQSHAWTLEEVRSLHGKYLLWWHPEDKPTELNIVGYSKLRCNSSNSEPISPSSSLHKSASAKF